MSQLAIVEAFMNLPDTRRIGRTTPSTSVVLSLIHAGGDSGKSRIAGDWRLAKSI
jgi:hypothetical protein